MNAKFRVKQDIFDYLDSIGYAHQDYSIAVEALLFMPNGKLLLEKRGPTALDERGKLEGVGGGLDEGNEIIQQIYQEVEEELGEQIKCIIEAFLEIRFVRFDQPGYGLRNWVVVSFLGRITEGRPKIMEVGKVEEFVEISPEELNRLPESQLSKSLISGRRTYWSQYGSLPYYETNYSEAKTPITDESVLPGGVSSVLSESKSNYFVYGKGGRLYDRYDRDYIDFICGFGPISIGHGNTTITEAIYERMTTGFMFPSVSPLHHQLKTVLCRLIPSAEDSIFLKTGSEAVAAAIRLARSFTNKSKIIRCGFHGWHDEFISPYYSWHLFSADTNPSRLIPGIDEQKNRDVLLWSGEDVKDLEKLFQANQDEVAALIIDPIQIRDDIGENLRSIRQLTHEFGSLLIFDEIKTGFRVHLGGVQALYDVVPDITTLSKAIANGFPLSAVVGRADILSEASQTRIMGTYNNELLSIEAALRTLMILERTGTIDHLHQLGQRLIDGINAILQAHNLTTDVQAVPYRWSSLPALVYNMKSSTAKQLEASLRPEIIRQGVLLLTNHPNFIAVEHTHDDINLALDRINIAVQKAKKDRP